MSSPSILLLGSSDFSAQLAGMLGLPFAFAHHFDMGGTLDAVEIYRTCFEPSPLLERPYTIVSATVLAAESDERAAWLAAPSRLRRYGMRTGRLLPLLSPDEAMAHPDIEIALRMATSSLVGTPAHVVAELEKLAEATGADELMTFSPTHGLEERLWSLEALAQAWGLRG